MVRDLGAITSPTASAAVAVAVGDNDSITITCYSDLLTSTLLRLSALPTA